MTHVLIPTIASDLHAAAVTCVLHRKGHRATPVFGCDLPTRLVASMQIGDGGSAIAMRDASGELAVGAADAVWLRRPAYAVLPDDVHAGDRAIAARELEAFTRGIWSVVGRQAFWVNPLEAHRRASQKPRQLHEAVAAGLRIPPTLISNDPDAIRALLRGGEPIIYKPFHPAGWNDGDDLAFAYTAVVTEDDLPDDDTLRLTPGIFQPLIPKRHELRVTCIGDQLVTARLLSQDEAATRVDWRSRGGRVPLVPDTLPAAVEDACWLLLHRLGLVFGCIDLIVTPDGDVVFLEVNEQGQWLWIEEAAPELCILDRFTELLVQRRLDVAWRPGDAIRLADVAADTDALLAEYQRLHVAEPVEHIVPDDDALAS
jgi:hypothetical protein